LYINHPWKLKEESRERGNTGGHLTEPQRHGGEGVVVRAILCRFRQARE
jgi:hypothetical protein